MSFYTFLLVVILFMIATIIVVVSIIVILVARTLCRIDVCLHYAARRRDPFRLVVLLLKP